MSKWSINRFPGEVFTGDEQCELIFGTGAKLCSHEPKDGKECLFLSNNSFQI